MHRSILLMVSLSACATNIESLQLSIAPQVLGCPAAEVTLSPFKGVTHLAQGCGRERMMTCSPDGSQCFPMQDLKQRAAFELNCAQTSLQLTALDGDGFDVGVEGCGKRLVYQYAETAEGHYDWTPSRAHPTAREVVPISP